MSDDKRVTIPMSHVIEKCDVTFYASNLDEPLPLLPADGVLRLKPSDLVEATDKARVMRCF